MHRDKRHAHPTKMSAVRQLATTSTIRNGRMATGHQQHREGIYLRRRDTMPAMIINAPLLPFGCREVVPEGPPKSFVNGVEVAYNWLVSEEVVMLSSYKLRAMSGMATQG